MCYKRKEAWMSEMFASGDWEKCQSSAYWAEQVRELDEQLKPSSWNPFGVNVKEETCVTE